MRLFAMIALVVSANSFATEYVSKKVSMTFIGDGFNRIYMRCENAKDIVASHLESLGAINVKMNCSGGLDDWYPSRILTPMSFSAKFDAPVPAANDVVENVVLGSVHAHEDCYFNTQFLNKALPLFPGVKVLSKRASCMNNESRWSYTLEVTK